MYLKPKAFGISCLIFFAGVVSSSCDNNHSITTPTVTVFEQHNFPEHLSEWGVLFRQGNELRLNSGVIAYDLQSPLFTDYAHKLRTIWLPPGKIAEVDPEINLPIGSIVTKTFYYPKNEAGLLKSESYDKDYISGGLNLNKVQLLETRVMVHLHDGWHGLPYVWDEQQRTARLEITGAAKKITLQDEKNNEVSTDFTYIVPDSNQCQSCHVDNMNTEQMSLLGIKWRHLNKPYTGVFQTDNQLQHWKNSGVFKSIPDVIESNVDWESQNHSTEARARSYLDINCGHCHNPEGPADTSGLFLSNDSAYQSMTDPLRLGVCKPPVAAGQGTGGRKLGIWPGLANQSILSYRMESTDLGAMMPELGRSLVDQEGLALINNWINAMPGTCH